jgi:hypothetical protein
MQVMGGDDDGRVELVFIHMQKAVKVFFVGWGLQPGAEEAFSEGIVGYIRRVTSDRNDGFILLEEHLVEKLLRP